MWDFSLMRTGIIVSSISFSYCLENEAKRVKNNNFIMTISGQKVILMYVCMYGVIYIYESDLVWRMHLMIIKD